LDSEQQYKSELWQILITHVLTWACISPTTICCWMTWQRFWYASRKKGYYVDGHEKCATIQYQWEFCKLCKGFWELWTSWQIKIASRATHWM
jgi:hypothetical protein